MACQYDNHLVTPADYSASMKVTSKIAFAGSLIDIQAVATAAMPPAIPCTGLQAPQLRHYKQFLIGSWISLLLQASS